MMSFHFNKKKETGVKAVRVGKKNSLRRYYVKTLNVKFFRGMNISSFLYVKTVNGIYKNNHKYIYSHTYE